MLDCRIRRWDLLNGSSDIHVFLSQPCNFRKLGFTFGSPKYIISDQVYPPWWMWAVISGHGIQASLIEIDWGRADLRWIIKNTCKSTNGSALDKVTPSRISIGPMMYAFYHVILPILSRSRGPNYQFLEYLLKKVISKTFRETFFANGETVQACKNLLII